MVSSTSSGSGTSSGGELRVEYFRADPLSWRGFSTSEEVEA